MKKRKEEVPISDFFGGSQPKPFYDGDKAKRIIHFYNNYLYHDDIERKKTIIQNLFGSTGNDLRIEQPFFCKHGYNIHIGENFFADSDCSFIDIAEIRIGSNALIGSGVGIYTSAHHMDLKHPSNREYVAPVFIGNDVWIGGNTIIFPGVTIGDNVIVQAGSVVIHSIPSNVIVCGNPAKVVKAIEMENKLS